jgi:multiple sugar transport system permease protein
VSRRSNKGTRRKSPLGSRWTPYYFAAPAVIYLLVFQAVPLLQELRLSFTRTTLYTPNDNVWVGLANYLNIFASATFKQTVQVTVVYVGGCVAGAVAVGLGSALLLNSKFRGRGIARARLALPWAAPAVAVALIATWMLNAQYGVVNRLLSAVGLVAPGGLILESPDRALPAILVTTVWQLFPFCSVVLLAALQGVPQEVQEAATMDGAGAWWSFRVVTWPVIRPTVGLLVLLMTIWSIRRFELIWLMTKGGPVGTTNTLVIDLYSTGFQLFDLGKAAAIGMVGVVVSLLVIVASKLITGRAEREVLR